MLSKKPIPSIKSLEKDKPKLGNASKKVDSDERQKKAIPAKIPVARVKSIISNMLDSKSKQKQKTRLGAKTKAQIQAEYPKPSISAPSNITKKPSISKKIAAVPKADKLQSASVPKAKVRPSKAEKSIVPKSKPKSVERDPRLQLSKITPVRASFASKISRIPKRHQDPRASSKISNLTSSISALKKLDAELSKALKSSPKNNDDDEKTLIIGGTSIKLTDESAVRAKLLEDARILGALKRRIADLNANALAMEKKLKDDEKTKVQVVTPIVPSSLEANMNLKYQFQQSMQKERLKYSKLLAENERLAKEMKETIAEKSRQTKLTLQELHLSHANDIAGWRAKVRELEQDKLQFVEIITARQQELQKVIKEKDFLLKEMNTISRQNMHLSNKLGLESPSDSIEVEKQSNDSEKHKDAAEKSDKPVPHYAAKIVKKEIQMRPGVASLIEKENTIPRKKSRVEFKNNGEPDEVRVIPNQETLKNAKIQLEYKAYVEKNK